MSRNPSPSKFIQFLKLGGSLITDKNKPHTHRSKILRRIAEEISNAYHENPEMRLILGHGSGSYGHRPAEKYKTRQGVEKPSDWYGFIEVLQEAALLNHLVLETLHNVGLPAISFPPSGSVITKDRNILGWNLEPIRAALEANLLPVTYGDAVFDHTLGGTILSTEELFVYLSREFQPKRVLIAGTEAGVWQDYPNRTKLIDEITLDNFSTVLPTITGSEATDVTGGMASKVKQMLIMIKDVPGIECLIFSGELRGSIQDVLLGSRQGTWLH
jgi:isopentenyl phosphate kinase